MFWVLLLFLGRVSNADSQVVEVIDQNGKLSVAQDDGYGKDMHVCVYHEEEPISCGRISECQDKLCGVEVLEQVEDVMVGDIVRPYDRAVLPPVPPPTPEIAVETPPSPQCELKGKPETRAEMICYHRALIREKNYERPDIYDDF